MSEGALPQRSRRVRKRQRADGSSDATARPSRRYVPVGALTVQQFEYLDHTADIQIHAWAASLEEAFAQSALAMFNYMTPLEYVEEKPEVTVEGASLLFNYLHELIVAFGTEDIVCKSMRVSELCTDDGDAFLRYTGRGDRFSLEKHPQGTEVKAVTYSNMQITHTAAAGGAGGARGEAGGAGVVDG